MIEKFLNLNLNLNLNRFCYRQYDASRYAMDYILEANSSFVRFWSSKRLPFEPKGEALEARNRLRVALAGLPPMLGLRAEFLSNDTSFCDVENVLLYNVGMSSFSATGRNQITLVRSERKPDPTPEGKELPYCHYYSTVESSAGLGTTAVVTRRFELPSKISLAAVWLNARLAATAGRCLRLSNLGMRVQVTLPASDRRGLPTMLKSLLDGLVSSLHCHNGSSLDVVLPRLSKQLGVDASVLERALISGPKELGSRSLIHPFRQSVQWNPADELFTQLHISRSNGETPSCVMEVFEM